MGLHIRNNFFMKIYFYFVRLFTTKKDETDNKEKQIFLNDFENMEPDSSDLIFME